MKETIKKQITKLDEKLIEKLNEEAMETIFHDDVDEIDEYIFRHKEEFYKELLQKTNY